MPGHEKRSILIIFEPRKNPGYVLDVLTFLRAKRAKENKRAAKPRAQNFAPPLEKILGKTTVHMWSFFAYLFLIEIKFVTIFYIFRAENKLQICISVPTHSFYLLVKIHC